MFKLRSITDFFKPTAQPRQNKRPAPDDDAEKTRVARRSRSNTPQSTDQKLETKASEDVSDEDTREGEGTLEGHLDRSILPSRSPKCETANSFHGESVGTRQKTEPQGPVLTSSQRVVRNGEVMIQNSDEESDSSLDDIDDLLARKSAMRSSPPDQAELALPPSAKQRDRQNGASTRSRTKGPARARRPSPSLPPLPIYEFSLDSLEQRGKDDRALEADAAKARTLLDSLETQKSAAHIQTGPGAKVDAKLLSSVIEDDGGENDMGRIMTALTRTNAFDHGKSWSFFDDLQMSARADHARIPIPRDTQWQGILDDTIFRQQAFLSGYIGEMASKGNVPDDLLLWVIDAGQQSPWKFGTEAQDRITSLLTPTLFDRLLQNIGASTEAVDIQRSINPVASSLQDKQDRDQSNLLSLLNLISGVSGHLSVSSRQYAICILCRLSLDTSVARNCETIAAIEKATSSLVESIPDEEINQEFQALSTIIYPSVQDSTLRLQMLQSIPASSSRMSLLRRRLAMAFFFENEAFLRKADDDLIDMKLIAHHLRKPLFKIRYDTDYSELSASISMLSIGIESGDRPPPENDKQEIVAFNADVDLVTGRISEMYSHIVDTAAHVKRTEAKEVLEAFQSQLLYAIRTKPKAKMGLFDDSTAERALMRGFLGKGLVEE
ncbi:hypothetical protein MMC07_007814 [Pseudocyphellaria aurata]|nr:hypothetical protein [Pseudocyphellaria aurata]